MEKIDTTQLQLILEEEGYPFSVMEDATYTTISMEKSIFLDDLYNIIVRAGLHSDKILISASGNEDTFDLFI